ncbi:MAG: response regulator transcription factor [Rubrivivax sp.]|nr:response regulator transcription factor [Rubrivivax sp.]
MRVLLVDDHEVVWSGMRGVVARVAAAHRPLPAAAAPLQWHCARNLADALALGGAAPDPTGPLDLVLLDYHLPDADGLVALRRLRDRYEGVPIVVVSGDEQPATIRRCIDAGAAGYIPKTVSEAEMVAALEVVMARGVYLPPLALLEPVPAAAAAAPGARDDGAQAGCVADEALAGFLAAELSPRQRQVLAQALRGRPNKAIARDLGIAENTVTVHLAMAFRALGVRNRTEAMYRVLAADAVHAVERW